MEKAGFKVLAIPGERTNSKITFYDDINKNIDTDYRIGRGVDFHRFESGNGITLGDIFIDCNLSIVAHSDGDIVLHSIAQQSPEEQSHLIKKGPGPWALGPTALGPQLRRSRQALN